MRPAPSRTRLGRGAALVAVAAGLAVVAAGCGSKSSAPPPSTGSTATASGTTTTTPTKTAAVTGNSCPIVVDESKADFFPIQPSFSAGYTMTAQKLGSATADWAYVVESDFPYSQWMAWYIYDTAGVPLYKFSDSDIKPDSGSTNPFVDGKPILATPRSFHLYLMPHTTPQSVVSGMQSKGENVALLPAVGSSPGVSIVSRSYWSFLKDGLGNYDRFGYHGPTKTPFPTIKAYLVDAKTGALTSTPVGDCGAQSQLPQKLWYDEQTRTPILTFEHAPRPTDRDLQDIPHYLLQTGSVSGSAGAEFPPSPVPTEVQFYRNDAAKAPYADVQSAPPAGSPPDACGGYVMANLPNDVVSLVHVPQVPSFPDYRGATAKTLNRSSSYDVAFYSVVIYGATKQLDAYGTVENSQLGNRQLAKNADGSATVVLYPQSATQQQLDRIVAVVEANGWNLLRSGVQTAVAPNLLVIREKGQNKQWKNALSANDVTQGAPCPQSTNPSLPLPQDPPSAQVTQSNGMGLTAPEGQNCTVDEFLSGSCLSAFQARLRKAGEKWSAKGDWPAQKAP